MYSVFVSLFAIFFQSATLGDSLKSEVRKASSPEAKAELFYQLARAYYASDQDLAIAYADSAIAIADSNQDQKLKANSLNIKGVSSLIKSDYEAAMKSHLDALAIREQLQDTVGLLESHLNLGNILYRTGSAREAAVRYRKAFQYARLSGNQRGQGLLFNNLGSYFKDLWTETDNPSDLDSAKFYLVSALETKKSLGDFRGTINTLNLLSEIGRLESDLSTAEKYLTQALDLSTGLEDLELQISLLSELTEFNLELGKASEALKYALQSFKLAEGMNSLYHISSTSGLVSNSYETMGDFKNALFYSQKKLKSIQELYQNQNKEVTENLLIKYETEKKELENQRLIKEQDFLDLSIRRKNELLIGAGVLLIGLAGVWVFQRRKNGQLAKAHKQTQNLLAELQLKNEEIETQAQRLNESNLALTESNRIRQRLFSVLSHDLKAPLSSLSAILDIWTDELISKRELQDMLPKVTNQIGSVRSLMDNLLEWAQAELDHSQIVHSQVLVREVVDDVLNHLSSAWEPKGLVISNEIPSSVTVVSDRDRLSFILRNLISNAIKYTPPAGAITIFFDSASGNRIGVKDTGVGMTDAGIEALFKGRQYSQLGTLGEKGTGVGLLLCQEFAQSLGASLQVESQVGVGSTFALTWDSDFQA